MIKISIAGTVGVPASYGGFETLADNLIKYAFNNNFKNDINLFVYCSTKNFTKDEDYYLNAQKRFINLPANGFFSIFYDAISLYDAVRKKDDVVLLLGVSGALILPLVRLFSKTKIICNIDGLEWKREKWGFFTKKFLKISEWFAINFSNEIIADNQGIADYIKKNYGEIKYQVIAYGGDHLLKARYKGIKAKIPNNFLLALCRIEPENNVELILESFSLQPNQNLLFIGNWKHSSFGQKIHDKYSIFRNIYLMNPIYDLDILYTLRSKAICYIHGHSAGGTNPSLVEMMHFGKPIIAYDCIYNRYTTNNRAIYFNSVQNLLNLLNSIDSHPNILCDGCGDEMLKIAKKEYTWDIIGNSYFELLTANKVFNQKHK